MLSDITDKTLGEIVLASSLANGRIFGHTLLFCLLLLMGASHIYKKKNNRSVLTIPAASFLHIMEDRMWMTPQTLFWPLLGWEFPDGYRSAGIMDYFLIIFQNTYTPSIGFVFIAEMLGLVILVIVYLQHKKKRKKPL